MTDNSHTATLRDLLQKRSLVLRATRDFFHGTGFLEVETPHRVPVPIPEAHIDLIESDGWVLQPSPELCMKRLLSMGFEQIFQICRCWRYGERGDLHLPEFTMLEWYRINADYTTLMHDCMALTRTVANSLGLNGKIERKGKSINLDDEWEQLTVATAYDRFAGISVQEALERDIFDEIMVTEIEPRLGVQRPTFLVDYPAVRGSLARRKPTDESVVERFELYIDGIELANAFSELVDSKEQQSRFYQEQTERNLAGKPVYGIPENLLTALDTLPPSAGIALGIDRLCMVLTGATAIDSVVAFTPETL